MSVSENRFGVADYIIFIIMLFLSSLIGLYHGCIKHQRTAGEFLLGNRQMTVFPIGCSLFASFVSAINLLSLPAEIYAFGTQFSLLVIAYTFIPITTYLYLPVFYNLGLTSVNEYLEKRFNKAVRSCGAIVFVLQMLLYLAVAVHAPALALNQVTGISIWSCVAAIIIICTAYTIIGGLRAVMWTDVLQVFFMFTALIVLLIKGTIHVGGIQEILDANKDRLIFTEVSLNPHETHTVWTQSIGGAIMWIAVYGVNQTQVQRFLSAKSIRVARRASWLNVVGLWFNMAINMSMGLLMYAYFRDCDPLLSQEINNRDQLLPLFAMKMFNQLPGLPGLFVAGIFSGSLSTLSSGLNSLSAITLEDFVLKFPRMKNIPTEKASLIAKLLAFFYGVLCLLCILLVENYSSLVQAALSLFGLIGGPLLGLFTLGMFLPWANSLGSGLGTVIGLAFTLWMGFGSLIYKTPRATLSLHCSNSTLLNSTSTHPNTSVFSAIYGISYMWFGPIGFLIVLILGLTISFISGANKPTDVNSELLSPLIRHQFPDSHTWQPPTNQIELQQTCK